MATKSISQLDTQATANETDLFEVAIVDANSASGYASKKESGAAIADAIIGEYQYPLRLTETTAKTVSGAINEIAGEVADIKDLDGSASGDIASFVDGSDNPLKALTISIEAVQSGSGDPSPTNVRPITGWTDANIPVRGFNIWDEEWENGFYLDDGTPVANSTRIRCKNRIVVRPSTTYYVYAGGSNNYELYIIIYDSVGAYVRKQLVRNTTFTTFENAHYLLFYVVGISTYNNDISINYPSTKTNYHAHAGTTTNIDWQSTAGTVYGGTLDVKNWVLTVDRATADLGTLNWVYISANAFFTVKINDMRNDINIDLMSSQYKYIGFKGDADMANVQDKTLAQASRYVKIKDLSYTSASDFKTAINGVQLVYPLATPITYQLTPTEVRSLLGVNNVWADCGSITEFKYTRDLNLCINDIISRLEALEGASSSRSVSLSTNLTKSIVSDSSANEGKTEETEEETKEEAQKNER